MEPRLGRLRRQDGGIRGLGPHRYAVHRMDGALVHEINLNTADAGKYSERNEW